MLIRDKNKTFPFYVVVYTQKMTVREFFFTKPTAQYNFIQRISQRESYRKCHYGSIYIRNIFIHNKAERFSHYQHKRIYKYSQM